MNSIEDKKTVLKRTLKILYSNTVIIDSKVVSQNAFHYHKNFNRRKKSQKNTITNIILHIHMFPNNISNHHFHQIYTGHQFPHLSPKCCCLYLGLDLVNCPNYFTLDWFLQRKEELDFQTNLAIISTHIFSIHTQTDLVFSYTGILHLVAAVLSEKIPSFSLFYHTE